MNKKETTFLKNTSEDMSFVSPPLLCDCNPPLEAVSSMDI